MFVFFVMSVFFLAGGVAFADSITPDSFSATVNVGDSVTIHKTVTIDSAPPTSALVDVFFLTDSTGSMGGTITSVRNAATQIMTQVSGLGNVAFGCGEYRDVGDAFTYRTSTDITSNTAAVQAGINTWTAGGGGDYPEANLYALQQVADTASWRENSTRILVWFGDAPSHDPSVGVTEGAATAALVDNNIRVQAMNVGYAGMDGYGQATRIANATDGNIYSGTLNPSNVVSVITSAITSTFMNYSNVSLDLSAVPAGLTATVTPAAGYTGAYDRSATRTFEYDVTLTGATAGTFNFSINALVDGGIVASELDSITVNNGGGPAPVPEPATMLLIGTGLLGVAGLKKRAKKQ
jgi:hypothetical protein